MSVKVRPYRKGTWEVDIRIEHANGQAERQRRVAPVSSKADAARWGKARERELLLRGPRSKKDKKREEVPTLAEFAPRFMQGYAVANRLKPSGIASKESVIRCHLVPFFGAMRLDAIGNEDIQRFKGKLEDRAAKTVNNALSVLRIMLRVATEWDVIPTMPCTIRQLKVPKEHARFHDFDEYDRLVEAARRLDWNGYLVVLLGGDAGLRCGEIMGLHWTDVDLKKRQLRVSKSDWKGHLTTTKSGRPRCVPMTKRLAAALVQHRHLKGERVVTQEDGKPLTQKIVQCLVKRAARVANLEHEGVHVLRHHAGFRIMPGQIAPAGVRLAFAGVDSA